MGIWKELENHHFTIPNKITNSATKLVNEWLMGTRLYRVKVRQSRFVIQSNEVLIDRNKKGNVPWQWRDHTGLSLIHHVCFIFTKKILVLAMVGCISLIVTRSIHITYIVIYDKEFSWNRKSNLFSKSLSWEKKKKGTILDWKTRNTGLDAMPSHKKDPTL